MQEVTGSIPVISTRTKSTAQECAVLFFLHRHSKRRELPTKGKPPLSRLQTLNSCWTFAQNYGIMHSAIAGIVHRLVYQPSKLRRWVRFPLPAPSFLDAGSSRISVFLYALAPLLAPLSIFAAEKGFISAQRKKAPSDRFGSKGALLLYALYADFLLSLILCKRVRTIFGASRKWSPTFA